MGMLHRPDISFQLCNCVVLSAKIDGLLCEEQFHELKSFFKMAYACACVAKRYPHALRLIWRDACSQTNFKTARGEQIQRGSFSSKHNGMAILITEHKTAEAQHGRCF